MLQAVGVGAKRSLPAAATLNWVLKDGLGKIGRISVGALFGSGFDSDLKVRQGFLKDSIPLYLLKSVYCTYAAD